MRALSVANWMSESATALGITREEFIREWFAIAIALREHGALTVGGQSNMRKAFTQLMQAHNNSVEEIA